MAEFPKRKCIRIKGYDYSTPGAYFITVCVASRNPILWNVGAATCRPDLSNIGSVVETAILQIPKLYPMISVDNYCVMPDHIHMILSINTDEDGRQIAAPTGSIDRQVNKFQFNALFQIRTIQRLPLMRELSA